MTPATEIATIPLRAGADIEDVSSAAGKVWQSTLDAVSQQDGFQRAYYGRELESPSVLQLLIDWDCYESHQNFIKDPSYGAFVKNLLTIVDGSIIMHHASFAPHPPSAAVSHTTSPLTEVLTCFLPSQDESFKKNALEFLEVVKVKAEGYTASAHAWIIEDVEHEGLGSGKKGNAFIVLLGWESLEAHMAFRETKAFKDNVHLLRDGPVGMEVHHTAFVAR